MRNENSRPEHNFKAPRTGTGRNEDILDVNFDDEVEEIPDIRFRVRQIVNEFLNYQTKDKLVVDLDSPDERDPVEDKRRKRLSAEARDLEMKYLGKLYKDVVYSTLAKLPAHHLQNNPLACTIASALNILEIFKLRGNLTERDIAQYIGEDGSFKEISIDKTLDLLKVKGLDNERVGSVLEMIERLIDGQIIMYTIPGSIRHRVVISAVKINKGKIDFLFNDPLKKDPYWVPYQDIVKGFGYDLQWERSAEAIIKSQS